MSAPERRALILAILFLTVGWGAKLLPRVVCDNCDALSYVEALPGSDEDTQEYALVSPQGAQGSTSQHHASKSKRKTLSGPLHVNQASASDFQGIKGVGSVLAQRIIEFRNQHGKIHGPKDLALVRGIGKKKLDNLLPFLIFD